MTSMDLVIEAYKRDVDRTLLRENLELTPEQRVLELMALLRAAEEFQRAGRALRGSTLSRLNLHICAAPRQDSPFAGNEARSRRASTSL